MLATRCHASCSEDEDGGALSGDEDDDDLDDQGELVRGRLRLVLVFVCSLAACA